MNNLGVVNAESVKTAVDALCDALASLLATRQAALRRLDNPTGDGKMWELALDDVPVCAVEVSTQVWFRDPETGRALEDVLGTLWALISEIARPVLRLPAPAPGGE